MMSYELESMPLGERVVFFVESELLNTSQCCMKDLEIASVVQFFDVLCSKEKLKIELWKLNCCHIRK